MVPLFIELFNQTKDTLESIENFVQLSRGKFRDKEFGDLFYQVVTEDIEKTDTVLTHFLDYIKVSTPIRKRNTIHTLIEELLKRYKVQWEEKKIELFKNFENDLPEVTVPDEHLRYILDTFLQYAMTSISPNGSIEFLTRSLVPQKLADQDRIFLKQDGKYVEVSVIFTGFKKPMNQLLKGLETPSPQIEMVPDLALGLVDNIVRRNHGTMTLVEEAEKARTFISMKFPVDRRKAVHYRVFF